MATLGIPTNMSEIRTGNFFVPMLIPLSLESNLNTGLAKAKVNHGNLNIMDVFGSLNILNLALSLPFTLPKLAFKDMSDKSSMVISSVPGLDGGYQFKLKSGICTGRAWAGWSPPSVDHFNGMIITGNGNTMLVTMATDKVHIENMDELFGSIMDNIKDFMKEEMNLEGKL